eukprot:PhM_4_TR2469/c0_g1_i1/m.11247
MHERPEGLPLHIRDDAVDRRIDRLSRILHSARGPAVVGRPATAVRRQSHAPQQGTVRPRSALAGATMKTEPVGGKTMNSHPTDDGSTPTPSLPETPRAAANLSPSTEEPSFLPNNVNFHFYPSDPEEALSALEYVTNSFGCHPALQLLLRNIRNVLAVAIFPEAPTLTSTHRISYDGMEPTMWITRRADEYWRDFVPLRTVLTLTQQKLLALQRTEGFELQRIFVRRQVGPVMKLHRTAIQRMFFSAWKAHTKRYTMIAGRCEQLRLRQSRTVLRKSFTAWYVDSRVEAAQQQRRVSEALQSHLHDERTKVGILTQNTHRAVEYARELHSKLDDLHAETKDERRYLESLKADPFVFDFRKPIVDVDGNELFQGTITFMSVDDVEPDMCFHAHPTDKKARYAISVWNRACVGPPPNPLHGNTDAAASETVSRWATSIVHRSVYPKAVTGIRHVLTHFTVPNGILEAVVAPHERARVSNLEAHEQKWRVAAHNKVALTPVESFTGPKVAGAQIISADILMLLLQAVDGFSHSEVERYEAATTTQNEKWAMVFDALNRKGLTGGCTLPALQQQPPEDEDMGSVSTCSLRERIISLLHTYWLLKQTAATNSTAGRPSTPQSNFDSTSHHQFTSSSATSGATQRDAAGDRLVDLVADPTVDRSAAPTLESDVLEWCGQMCGRVFFNFDQDMAPDLHVCAAILSSVVHDLADIDALKIPASTAQYISDTCRNNGLQLGVGIEDLLHVTPSVRCRFLTAVYLQRYLGQAMSRTNPNASNAFSFSSADHSMTRKGKGSKKSNVSSRTRKKRSTIMSIASPTLSSTVTDFS